MATSNGDGGWSADGVPNKVDVVVAGGGIAGITAAIELAECNKRVALIERQPSIGGQVTGMHQYFPKLCPPSCGLEINLKRIKNSPYISIHTLAEVIDVAGASGSYKVRVRIDPRFVNERCTACGKCSDICEIDRANEMDYGLSKTKAIYLPHLMAYPLRYVVDPRFASDGRMKRCEESCEYKAIDLSMKPKEVILECKSIIWATGWKPYDAARLDKLGFGAYPNVVTNVIMERIASANGPYNGKVRRPSDGKEIRSVGFVQCAGSRDENHLPYCSAVCCMASMKQATYIRSLYPEAEIHIFYIDIRSPGKLEDFYFKMQADEKIHFHRGKVASIAEVPDSNNLILESEDTMAGNIHKTEVELAVLAVGMVPNAAFTRPPGAPPLDEFGFIRANAGGGVVGAGTAARPCDVAGTVQDATGAAMRALMSAGGR